jgi:hypothetical protein
MLQFGGVATCSLCGSTGVTMTTCPLNTKAKNPSPAKHPLAGSKKQVQVPVKEAVKEAVQAKLQAPKKITLKVKPATKKPSAGQKPEVETFELFIKRMHTDLINDLHYPATNASYILHFTDKDLDDFATAILAIAKQDLPDVVVNKFVLARYIIRNAIDGDLSEPDMKSAGIHLLNYYKYKAINGNGDIIRKAELIKKLIMDFGRSCFKKYRISDPTKWRLADMCDQMSVMSNIVEFTDGSFKDVPAGLTRESKNYVNNILLTTESVKELDNLAMMTTDKLSTFQFRGLSKTEADFVATFSDDMFKWINSDSDRQWHIDHEGPLLDSLADLLNTVLEFRKLSSPQAHRHLSVLTKFLDEYAVQISSVVILKMIIIARFMSSTTM